METLTCLPHRINHKQIICGGTYMSDLTATQCGCSNNTNNNNNNGCGCSSIIWILILLSCCGNNNNSGCGCGNGINNLFGGNGDNGCCSSLIWILLLFSCCGCGNYSRPGNTVHISYHISRVGLTASPFICTVLSCVPGAYTLGNTGKASEGAVYG